MKALVRKFSVGAFLAGLVIAFPAAAQQAAVKIVGPGAGTCAQYVVEISLSPLAERGYFAWAQGYMSGILLRAPPGKDEDLDLTPRTFPASRQAEFLRTYCSTHTSEDFADAVNELYRTLRAPPG